MIPLFKVFMPPEVDKPLLETLHSGFIGQGSKVEEFEQKLQYWLGNEYVLTVNSGTSALMLALRLANVGLGDEVIVSPMTCSASIMPIKAVGGNVVWCDINPNDGNIDADKIKPLITTKTKAIIAVHWAGYPCALDEINSMAEEYGLAVIEDAAHALGAIYRGKKIGSHSQFVCFSLQAIKHITTIEGGILACKDVGNYHRGKLLRWYGIDRDCPRRDLRCEADIIEWGYKMNMTDVQAVIGIEQLKHIDNILAKHRKNAEYYNNEIDIHRFKKIKRLHYQNDRLSSYWLYSILVDDKDAFREFMADQEIVVSAVHSRNDKHYCFRDVQNKNLPGVDEFSAHEISIPVHWALTNDDKLYIINKIEEYDRLR